MLASLLLYAMLSVTKVGLYAPALDSPYGMWPYLAVNLENTVSSREDPWDLEVGWTLEPVRRGGFTLALKPRDMVYKSAQFVGIKYHWTNSLDAAAGFRWGGARNFPYAAINFKFGSTMGYQ